MENQDKVLKKRSKNLKKDLYLLIGVLIVLMLSAIYVAYDIGYKNGEGNREEVRGSLDSMTTNLQETEHEYEQLQKQLKEIQDEYKEAKQLLNQKKQLQKDISRLKNKEKKSQENLSIIENEIKEKKQEIKGLNQTIEVSMQKTKYLPAGGFTVGKDIPPGRYVVKPDGGNGVYLVNNGTKANIMLGNRDESVYLEEYVLEFEKEDTIGASLPTKYEPVTSDSETEE